MTPFDAGFADGFEKAAQDAPKEQFRTAKRVGMFLHRKAKGPIRGAALLVGGMAAGHALSKAKPQAVARATRPQDDDD